MKLIALVAVVLGTITTTSFITAASQAAAAIGL